MKKEVLVIHAESRSAKESMLQDFRESYEEAMSCTLYNFRVACPCTTLILTLPSSGSSSKQQSIARSRWPR